MLIICNARAAPLVAAPGSLSPAAIRHSPVAVRQSYRVRRHLWMPSTASICTAGTRQHHPPPEARADVGEPVDFANAITPSSVLPWPHEADQRAQQIRSTSPLNYPTPPEPARPHFVQPAACSVHARPPPLRNIEKLNELGNLSPSPRRPLYATVPLQQAIQSNRLPTAKSQRSGAQRCVNTTARLTTAY